MDLYVWALIGNVLFLLGNIGMLGFMVHLHHDKQVGEKELDALRDAHAERHKLKKTP